MIPVKHRILVIGVGSIGERHLRCFLSTGRAQVSFCEINKELRLAVAGRYEVRHAFASVEDALGHEHDAAVVCTPAHRHVSIALELARRAGTHLLIEKPLSTCLEGIEDLRQIAEQKKLILAIGYVWREHPGLSAMKKAIASGRFGRPVEVVATAGQHFPTYRPAYRKTYYADRATGGGTIQDALTHVLNAGEWMAGPIQRLICDAEHQLLEGVAVEDTVHVLTRQGQALGSYCYNQYQAPNEMTLTVIAEHGTARFESHHVRWGWMARPETPWEYETFGPSDRDTLFIQQANHFLDALDGKSAPLCSLEEGLQTLRVNLAALASLTQQSWQTIQQES